MVVCVALAAGLVVFATRHTDHQNAGTVVQTVPRLTSKHVVLAGQAAPTFRLARLDHGYLNTADFRGKAYVVAFWASWCDPCRKELPVVQQVYAAHHGALPVVGVTFQDPQSDSRAFVQEHHITFPITPDDGYRIAKAFGVVNVPTTFFVDAQGIVRDRVAGDGTAQDIQNAFNRFLAG
jgi:peroxiredoxin